MSAAVDWLDLSRAPQAVVHHMKRSARKAGSDLTHAPAALVCGAALEFLLTHALTLDRSGGWYERFLLWVYTEVEHPSDEAACRRLFELADAAELRRIAPPPRRGPTALFRGEPTARAFDVSGTLSWTDDPDVARWFAWYLPGGVDPDDPGVFRLRVEDSDILAFWPDRLESEWICLLPSTARPELIERPTREDFERIQTDRRWLAAERDYGLVRV